MTGYLHISVNSVDEYGDVDLTDDGSEDEDEVDF